MPEWPDLEVYREALAARLLGETVIATQAPDLFLLRTVTPTLGELAGKRVVGISRQAKRLVFALEGEVFLVLHLMVLGRLHWQAAEANLPKAALWWLQTDRGRLWLSESGKKRRASLYVVQGPEGLGSHDPGGLEVFDIDLPAFAERLRAAPRTCKRALCDPAVFAAIGNAYSDEILHAAGISPLQLTRNLSDAQIAQLFSQTQAVLRLWRQRLSDEARGAFPEHVTAFRPDMAVHGRFGKPCPVCGAPVQRIVYAENECNYCAKCQTQGRLLADRALSRLLKDSWPKRLDG